MTAADTERLPESWPEEFTAICDSHRGRLVRWLTAIFGARDAEDIAQEALTRLYVRPGLLDEDADAWPWLAVVARNVGRDMARHNAFSTTVCSETLDQLPDSARVHDQVVARDDAERLHLALRAISARDRALIRLRDVQGVSVGDIAEQLGMNDNAVRQQLFRARKRLANAYLDLGGDRRAGIWTVLGVRFREFMRRHGHLAEPYAPSSSALFANAAPAMAAAVAGVLVFVTGGPAGPANASGGTVARGAYVPDGWDTPHGGHDRARSAADLSPKAPARPDDPDDELFADYDEQVGPVRLKGKGHDPLDNRDGIENEYTIDVYIPIVDTTFTVRYWEERGGPGPVCSTGLCPTAVPTPPAGT